MQTLDHIRKSFNGATSRAERLEIGQFLTPVAIAKFMNDISWETEVWIAESPTHLIHFNGERFLGPYQD